MITLRILSFAFLILCTFCFANCQQLQVKYSAAKLPIGEYCHRIHYDGDDSIYIFGGCFSNPQILKYSLKSDTIIQIGSLPSQFIHGSVEADDDGNMFLFGAGASMDILKFDVNKNTTSHVHKVPWWIYCVPTITSCNPKKSPNTTFILGSWDSYSKNWILTFNLITYKIANSPKRLPIDLTFASTVCVRGRAFVFPFLNNGNGSVWEFDLETHELFPVGQPDLPTFFTFPSTVSDGNLVYVIPGIGATINHTVVPIQSGLFVFDPDTNSTSLIPVENWPVNGGNHNFNYPPRCAYIHKFNRIHCFGGSSGVFEENGEIGYYTEHDEIFYIDMNGGMTTSTELIETTSETSTTTLNPYLFSCINRTNGFYPHPADCSRFIGCRGQELFHFECLPPSLFNPLIGNCDIPDSVVCGTSCVHKPDGHYSHPHNCSLFLVCRSEIATVLKCTPPLLFDPVLTFCNFPDTVNCEN